MLKQFPNYINGEWVTASKWTPNRNPSDVDDVIPTLAQRREPLLLSVDIAP